MELVRQMGDGDVNRAPALAGANSPFVIVTHVFGNVRSWVVGIVCDEPLDRDRPAEFRSSGSLAELETAHRELVARCETALATLDAARLDDRIVPRQVLFGEGESHEMTRREALLHPLEHAAIHVGQMQMTADLLRARDGS
jgi:uncharacterized damage-inducible protein DinB